MVEAEKGRANGVTCLNGKYVYARLEADGSRPVVSTVREAYNRHGAHNRGGQWGCRYLGTHCNTNNCNNNGNGEVPGPYHEKAAWGTEFGHGGGGSGGSGGSGSGKKGSGDKPGSGEKPGSGGKGSR